MGSEKPDLVAVPAGTDGVNDHALLLILAAQDVY